MAYLDVDKVLYGVQTAVALAFWTHLRSARPPSRMEKRSQRGRKDKSFFVECHKYPIYVLSKARIAFHGMHVIL